MLAICLAGMISRIVASTRSQSAAVSSMRVPVRARKCSLIWPPSTDGKEVLPQAGQRPDGEGQNRGGDHRAQENAPQSAGRSRAPFRAARDSARASARSRARIAIESGPEIRGCFALGVVFLEPEFRERRHQGSRQQVGGQHREHHGFGQRNEQKFGDSGQQEHRHEHDADGQASKRAPAGRSGARRREWRLRRPCPARGGS